MSQSTIAGRPRLVIAPSGGHAIAGLPASVGEETEFPLAGRTTIGSDPAQDIPLAGLAAEHAVIEYVAEDDEFVFVPSVSDGTATVAGAVQVTGLHHGDRLELDHWTLIFQRDETADHVRSDERARQGGQYAGGGITAGGGHSTETD